MTLTKIDAWGDVVQSLLLTLDMKVTDTNQRVLLFCKSKMTDITNVR